MNKKRVLFICAVAGLALAPVIFWTLQQSKSDIPEAGREETFLDLGISYLPVTPKVSDYYTLGVDFGALITEVAPEGPAAIAGLKEGDVILSYNGMKLDGEAPLFGMMRSCLPGSDVILEVWSGQSSGVIKIAHPVQQDDNRLPQNR